MARMTLRRLALAAFIIPVGVAALAVTIAVGWLDATHALLLALTGAILAAVSTLGLGLRRISARVQNLLKDQRKQAERLQKGLRDQAQRVRDSMDEVALLLKDLRGAAGEDRVELLTQLAQGAEILECVGEQITHLERSAEQLPVRLMEPVTKAVDRPIARQTKLHDRRFAKIEAQADLRGLITPRAPMPLPGSWALGADTNHRLILILWEHRPELIVEYGRRYPY